MEVVKETFTSEEGRKIETLLITGLKDISNKEEVLEKCVIAKSGEKTDSYGSCEIIDEQGKK